MNSNTVVVEPVVYDHTVSELLDMVLYGSYTPGVHDKELKERVALLEVQLETSAKDLDKLTEEHYLPISKQDQS